MFRYRIMIIATIAWLTLALNIERPDELFMFGNVNIDSFVYGLGAAVITLLLVFLPLTKMPDYVLYLPVLAIYGIGKVLTYNSDIDPARFTYLSLIEILGLVITIWLTKLLAGSINQFNTSIETSLLGQEQTNVLSTSEGEMVIRRNIDRARRFGRELTLMHIELGNMGSQIRRYWDQEEKVRHLYLQVQIAELMNYLFEKTDVRMWYQDNLVVCMLEASPEKARSTAWQVRQVLRDVLGIQAQVGVSYFPSDALIYQDLLEIAQHRIVPEETSEQHPKHA